MPNPATNSGIRDNHKRGVVADFLKAKIHSGSRLSVVSAYFTIYAYDALREHLCQLFDTETKNGADMKLYNKLLAAAVDSIAKTFQKRVAAGLQSGRDFVIPDQQQQARETTDFELITWLVIKAS